MLAHEAPHAALEGLLAHPVLEHAEHVTLPEIDFAQRPANERDVDVEDVTRFEAPSRQPNSAGVYDQSISVLNVFTQYAF